MKVVNGILKKINTKDLRDGVLIIPEGVTKIYYRSLENIRQKIKKVIFPKSMKVIQSNSFTRCDSLEEVIFPEVLEEIAESVFLDCSHLSSVKLPSTLKKIGRAAFAMTAITSIKLPGGIKIVESNAFSRCSQLKEVILEEGITIIRENAFQNCSKLEKVTLEKGITTIEENAFHGCSNLKEINIPDGLISIGNGAFEYCENLKNITFPKSLESIGKYAFFNAGLKEIELPEKITEIKDSTFDSCFALSKVVLRGAITEIGHSAFSSTRIKNIDLPNSIYKIGKAAFYHCPELEKAILPENLEILEDSTYAGCMNLSEVIFPKELKKIEDSTFEDCQNLKKVTLKENLISIGMNAFSRCESLNELDLPKSLEAIGEAAFRETGTKTLITPWGKYNSDSKMENVVVTYLYLFSNYILKEKYENIEEFLNNKDISETISGKGAPIDNPESIQKFKNLFSKLRKQYNVNSSIFPFLDLQTTKNFSYSTWKKIADILNSFLSISEMIEAFSEMIEVFGLFHKDQKTNQRINQFQNLLKEMEIPLSIAEYQELIDDFKYFILENPSSSYGIEELEKSFDKKEIEVYKLKSEVRINEEFEMYLSGNNILTMEERKKLKKVTGSYGKRLNDFINENYELEKISIYALNEFGNNNPYIKEYLFNLDALGCLNGIALHNIFDGCEKRYNEDFYDFLIDNLPFILRNYTTQSYVKEIQKNFESIKRYYLRNAGSEKVTLKQALDYIKSIKLTYHKGNQELAILAKKSGVDSQSAFNYYQDIYEKNQLRKLYSLVRRSNVYEIDGFKIKAELLRKDDSFALFVGEKNCTNCCQRYGGVGHNCMAHAASSDDGGIFVTRLLKDGEWILLTESWDWQNNNLYCHDNVEGTEFFKNGSSDLKKAVMKVFVLDAEFIIEKSKKEVADYVSTRRKILKKSSLEETQEKLDELEKLKQREVIKAVTVGAGYDDLGLKRFLSKKININEEFFIDNKKYSLANFQPVNYNSSKPYFDSNFEAYSDAASTQYILAGNIDDLVIDDKELEPIYRDERRILKEETDGIKDYTLSKVCAMKKEAYPNHMLKHQDIDWKDYKDSSIYLGEDWYLVYENKENGNIYISDLARITPTLEDERGIQQKEILFTLSVLINSSNEIEADLKEDNSYILYLMNKRLGYIEQIGEDISYPYDKEEETKVVSQEEQQEILKNRKNKEDSKEKIIMHKVSFKKA